MYHTYVLQSQKDNGLYIGFTENDPEKRLIEHNKGKVPSSKDKRPLKLIYYESYLNKKDALNREKFLKSGSGRKYIKKQLKNYFNLAKNDNLYNKNIGSNTLCLPRSQN